MQNTLKFKEFNVFPESWNRKIIVPFSFDPFQCFADITIVVGVLSVCAATPIFFRVAATVKSSEKSGEGRRRAIYDEGTNVESGEKREILNGRERIRHGRRKRSID